MMHPEQGVRRCDRHVTHRTIDPHVYKIMRPIRIRSFESEREGTIMSSRHNGCLDRLRCWQFPINGSRCVARIASHTDWSSVGVGDSGGLKIYHPFRNGSLIHPTPIRHKKCWLELLHSLLKVDQIQAVPGKEAEGPGRHTRHCMHIMGHIPVNAN